MDCNARNLPVWTLVLLLAPLGACRSSTPKSQASQSAEHGAVHWTYTGATGPSTWASLDEGNSACGAGHSQSPIDIAQPSGADLPDIVFEYKPSTIEFVNNGHSVQNNYQPGSFITVDGKRYQLAQLHFHAPSEHHVRGKSYDAEMHLVHKADDGALAVVGVLIESGRENKAFEKLWSQMPETKGDDNKSADTIDAAALLPADRTAYRYGGSLTTPPCSEGVNWSILVTPIQMSGQQLATFTKLYHGNNRPVQPLNGRLVLEDVTR